MKQIFLLLMTVLLFVQKGSAQQTPENKGQWFVFLDNTYEPTVSDVVEITESLPNMQSGKKYQLSNGKAFYCYSPEKWLEKMKEILSEIKGAQVTDVADELSQGTIVPWDDNISATTTNYAVTDGKVWEVSSNYKGGPGVKVLVYKGYPVLKTAKACLNPNKPEIVVAKAEKLPGKKGPSTIEKGSNGTTIINNYYTVAPAPAAEIPIPKVLDQPVDNKPNVNVSLNFDFLFYTFLGIQGNQQQCEQQYQERCRRDRTYDQRCRQTYSCWKPQRRYDGPPIGSNPRYDGPPIGTGNRYDGQAIDRSYDGQGNNVVASNQYANRNSRRNNSDANNYQQQQSTNRRGLINDRYIYGRK